MQMYVNFVKDAIFADMKRIFTIIFLIMCGVGAAWSHTKSVQAIKTDVPERAEGQCDVIGLRVAPIDSVGVGIIGLGMRGEDAVERFTHIPGCRVVAVCDVEADRVAKAQNILKKEGAPEAVGYGGSEEVWKELVGRGDIDLVYICTDWKHHTPIALEAMNNGKHVAIEVPAAMNLDEIWALVDKAEKKRLHCMMLENCVYDFFELNTLNMAQKGLFGEVLHVEGSYIHNLDEFWPYYWHNWRMDYNRKHRGDVYPTHGIGPACQLLGLHRGDKMNTLVAMDTKAVNGPAYIRRHTGEEVSDFANGDHTMTMIRTENGKTIHIQHDVMTPRPYSRMYQLTGTKGFANKYPMSGYAFEPEQIAGDSVPDHQNLSAHGFINDAQRKALEAKYRHPIIERVGEVAKKVGGHGGMDYMMDYRLIYCLRNGLPLDMDVYDLAEWCSLIPLSALSIENGSAAVEVPDFTRGAWNKVKGYTQAWAD